MREEGGCRSEKRATVEDKIGMRAGGEANLMTERGEESARHGAAVSRQPANTAGGVEKNGQVRDYEKRWLSKK